MSKKIYLDAPNVGELEKKYLNNAIDTGYVSSVGPFVSEFEERFAAYVGAKKAVSTQSGTAALERALYELRIGEGDEVIVPVLTFVATVNPVIYVGAKPVFIDVDYQTWNISPKEIIKSINKKTKAIIPVHLYGNPCNMDEIMDIAKKKGLYVIEDATESLGAFYKGKHTGTFGNMGCFSFNGNKVITTGGGGMVVGDDMAKMKHIKFLANQAKDEVKEDYHSEIGFNDRMTNIEAGLGLAQMDRLGIFIEKKRRFHDIYRDELAGIKSVSFQEGYEDADSSWWLTCLLFKKHADINGLRNALRSKEVPTRRVFMPLTELPPYKIYKRSECKNAYDIYNKGLCLPSSTLNSEDDIRYVCKKIKEIVAE